MATSGHRVYASGPAPPGVVGLALGAPSEPREPRESDAEQ
jgi:hypothetical protein